MFFIPHATSPTYALFVFQATVLLAVNLSFITVPGINQNGGNASGGQIASLCSTVLSIGCIVIGLLLVSEDHTDPKTDGLLVRVYSFVCPL